MAKKPQQPDVSKDKPRKIEKPEAAELDDDELKSVSGGLGSVGGAALSSGDVCISQL
jgi:bacteriocin-like protein